MNEMASRSKVGAGIDLNDDPQHTKLVTLAQAQTRILALLASAVAAEFRARADLRRKKSGETPENLDKSPP